MTVAEQRTPARVLLVGDDSAAARDVAAGDFDALVVVPADVEAVLAAPPVDLVVLLVPFADAAAADAVAEAALRRAGAADDSNAAGALALAPVRPVDHDSPGTPVVPRPLREGARFAGVSRVGRRSVVLLAPGAATPEEAAGADGALLAIAQLLPDAAGVEPAAAAAITAPALDEVLPKARRVDVKKIKKTTGAPKRRKRSRAAKTWARLRTRPGLLVAAGVALLVVLAVAVLVGITAALTLLAVLLVLLVLLRLETTTRRIRRAVANLADEAATRDDVQGLAHEVDRVRAELLEARTEEAMRALRRSASRA